MVKKFLKCLITLKESHCPLVLQSEQGLSIFTVLHVSVQTQINKVDLNFVLLSRVPIEIKEFGQSTQVPIQYV